MNPLSPFFHCDICSLPYNPLSLPLLLNRATIPSIEEAGVGLKDHDVPQRSISELRRRIGAMRGILRK